MIKVALDNKAVKTVQKAIGGGGSDNPDGTIVIKVPVKTTDTELVVNIDTDKIKAYLVEEFGDDILDYVIDSNGTNATFSILVTDNRSFEDAAEYINYGQKKNNCELIRCFLCGDSFSGVYAYNEAFGDPYNFPEITSYVLDDVLDSISSFNIAPSYTTVNDIYLAVLPDTMTLYVCFYNSADIDNPKYLKKSITLEEALSLIRTK